MNGLAVAGAVGGLMQGLEFARRMGEQDRQEARQARADELAAQRFENQDRRDEARMGLEQAKLDQDKAYQSGMMRIYQDREANDKQQAAAKLDLERAQLQTDTAYKNAVVANQAEDNRRQAGLAQAQIANLQADNALAAAQQREKERQQRQIEAAQKLHTYTPILQDPKADIPADFIDTFRAATYGVSPLVYAGQEGKDIVDTYEGVRTGKLGLDDPRVARALELTHPEVLERGIGDPVERDGVKGTVTGKRIARVVPMDDGQGGKKYAVAMQVDWQDAAGKPQAPYEAPLTEFGTTDPNDHVLLIGPEHFDERAAEALYASHKFGKPEVRARLLKAVEGQGKKIGKEDDPEMRDAKLKDIQARTRRNAAEADFAESMTRGKETDKSDGGAKRAPKQAEDYLKANPGLAGQFKAKYGYLPEGF